ncbi:thioesterase II family protein [Catellatospora vulcania]|uniref:thioesterase II family protein n=1 Tax=Catellatospora vulcania TaxID=1460450 RepID=UPI0018AF9CC0|nr:alpha/beta fold hydrolase [Catellatospora vulcania]
MTVPGIAASPWLPFPAAGRGVTVFCLPHAGGAARSYWSWANSTAYPGVDFVPVELPGRGSRITQAPVAELEVLTEQLAEVVDGYAVETGRPYALFGHSMGGLLAYHLAGRLAASARPGPVCVFVSGCRPPNRQSAVDLRGLDDGALVATLVRLGGLTAEMAAETELMAMVLPALRADLALFAGYRPPAAPLAIPIIALAGTGDPLAAPDDQKGWQAHTSRGLLRRVFGGGHFFLHDEPDPVLREIARVVATAAAVQSCR